jgi:hypothetical protein
MTTTFTPKDPAEAIYYGVDFASLLAVGETISSATVSNRALVLTDAGSAAMLSGSPVIAGSVVTQKIIAGLAGNTYRIGFSVVTSVGQTFVEAGDLVVAERD